MPDYPRYKSISYAIVSAHSSSLQRGVQLDERSGVRERVLLTNTRAQDIRCTGGTQGGDGGVQVTHGREFIAFDENSGRTIVDYVPFGRSIRSLSRSSNDCALLWTRD